MADDFTELRELHRKLEESKNHLEEEVQSRTYQLQEALEVKSRFLAVMSLGKFIPKLPVMSLIPVTDLGNR